MPRRVYYKVEGVEYTIYAMSRQDFVKAFCTEVDGEIVAMKAFTGYPSFYVPGTDLLWPIPPKGLEIHYQEEERIYAIMTFDDRDALLAAAHHSVSFLILDGERALKALAEDADAHT